MGKPDEQKAAPISPFGSFLVALIRIVVTAAALGSSAGIAFRAFRFFAGSDR